MKALSVKQPYADLIACGRKTIETRTWKTNYRGPLLICSSLKCHMDEIPFEFFQYIQTCFSYVPGIKKLYWKRGFAICKVDLIDVRKIRPV